MKGKEIFKRSKGITLIALVITIIVLLILAGVTIATLTGDNGLLSKASTAKNTVNESEIEEKLKLAYQDYYLGQHTESGYTFQNAVDKMFGEGVATVTESSGIYTIKVTNGKKYIFDPATAKAEEFNDPFNYGTKTKETVVAGDVISVKKDSIEENFTVVSNKNGVIVAMPHYNLISVNGVVKQANAENASSAIVTNFSSSNYWAQTENWNANPVDMAVDINMTEKNTNGTYKNNIQQYIDDYKTTLINSGIKVKNVRACTKTELDSDLAELDYYFALSIKNPSSTGYFYLGSANANVNDNVWRVSSADYDAGFARTKYSMPNGTGIRPVIEI